MRWTEPMTRGVELPLVWQLYKFGEPVEGEQFPVSGTVEVTLLPHEVRIYEREVSA